MNQNEDGVVRCIAQNIWPASKSEGVLERLYQTPDLESGGGALSLCRDREPRLGDA
jgi:hypothetical protein